MPEPAAAGRDLPGIVKRAKGDLPAGQLAGPAHVQSAAPSTGKVRASPPPPRPALASTPWATAPRIGDGIGQTHIRARHSGEVGVPRYVICTGASSDAKSVTRVLSV